MSDEQESEPCDVHGWRDCKRCRNRNPVSDWASAQREITRLNDELRTVQVELDRLRVQLAEIGETREAIQFRACQSPDGPLIDWTDLVVGQSMMIAPWPDSAGRVRLDFRQAQP
jgi:hypothetical protein